MVALDGGFLAVVKLWAGAASSEDLEAQDPLLG